MEKRFRDCYLHIGTEKTGTTTIQSFLGNNRRPLAKEGILYTASGGRAGSQMGFVAYAHSEPWKKDLGIFLKLHDARDHETFRNTLARQLESEFAAHPDCRTLLISSEHFHSRLQTEEEIGRLRDFLSTWVERFHVVVYLRRQDRVAVSFYSTAIKSGDAAPVLFPVASNGGELYYFDYESVCGNWAAVFGDTAMDVRVFDRSSFVGGELLPDFCTACGIALEGKALPENANESLSKAGIDFLLELNRQLPRVLDRQFNPVQTQLAGIVAQMCRGRGKVGTAAAARAFYEGYRAGNERLRARFLPERPVALFDDDFSDYPEHDGGPSPHYPDAVDIAIRLWRHKLQPDARLASFDELAASHRELNQAKADNAFLRGRLAIKNGNIENAKHSMRRALQLNDQHAGAHVMMARLCMQAGDREAARVHLEKARLHGKEAMPEIERLLSKLSHMSKQPSASRNAQTGKKPGKRPVQAEGAEKQPE